MVPALLAFHSAVLIDILALSAENQICEHMVSLGR